MLNTSVIIANKWLELLVSPVSKYGNRNILQYISMLDLPRPLCSSVLQSDWH
jgi:hypothetical protein